LGKNEDVTVMPEFKCLLIGSRMEKDMQPLFL